MKINVFRRILVETKPGMIRNETIGSSMVTWIDEIPSRKTAKVHQGKDGSPKPTGW